ncbi:hypothetical protein ABPG74_014040 [Tetrahymena malaccensis]
MKSVQIICIFLSKIYSLVSKINCGKIIGDLLSKQANVYYSERKNQIQNRQISLAQQSKDVCMQVCQIAKAPTLFNNLVVTRINNQYIIPSHIE